MRNITWSGVLILVAVVVYIAFFAPPSYRLVQPDGREAQRGRGAPRLDANECIRSTVQSLRKVTPIASGKARGIEFSAESGKLEGTVSKNGPPGEWPAELDVRRFLRRGAEGVPSREDSDVGINAVIVDTFGMGGSQRMFITTHNDRGVHFPDEVAESFMRCMLKRDYTVQKAERDWRSLRQSFSFSTAK